MSAYAVEVSFAPRDGRPLRGALSLLALLGFAIGFGHVAGAAVAAEASVYNVQATGTDDVAAAKKSLSEGLKVFGRLPLTAAPPASPPAPGPDAKTVAAPPAVSTPATSAAAASAPAAVTAVQPTQGASVAVGNTSVPRPAPGVGLPDAEQARYLDMAASMVKRGDIAGARVVLGKLERLGNGRATFELAQTFDPRVLESWNVRGIRADSDRARTLYEEAYRLGIAEAQDRVAGLDAPK